MQKSFFRAKQPGPCRAQKKESGASDAWPEPAQKEGPAQALCLARAGTKRRSVASVMPGRGQKKKESVADLCL